MLLAIHVIEKKIKIETLRWMVWKIFYQQQNKYIILEIQFRSPRNTKLMALNYKTYQQ